MLNNRYHLHSLDLAFLIHRKLTPSFVRIRERNLQIQLHCIIRILQGPKGQPHLLSNKSFLGARKHLWE